MIDGIRNDQCTLCKLHRTADVVCQIGFGPPTANVMVVSRMANSRQWQEEMELDLAERGLDITQIYYTQALKCRTFDQNASNVDVKACRKYLEAEIKAVKPKFILALGNEALLSVLGHSGITKYRGRVYQGDDWVCIPTVSPSAVKRNPGQRPGYMADLRLFVNRVMGKREGLKKPKYSVIDTKEKLEKLAQKLYETDELFWDVETTGDYYKSDGRIVSLSGTCLLKNGKLFVFALPLYHPESVWQHKHRAVLKFLKPALESIRKSTAHNGAYDMKWLIQYGVEIRFTFDTMLALHLLNEKIQKGLKPACMSRLGVEPWGIDTKDLLNKPLDEILQYNV